MFLILGGGEEVAAVAQEVTKTAKWLELMQSDQMRWSVQGGVGACYLVLASLFRYYFIEKLPGPIQKFFPVVGVGVAVPSAFFTSLVVPGIEAAELALSMGVAGAATHFTKKAEGQLDKTIIKKRSPSP